MANKTEIGLPELIQEPLVDEAVLRQNIVLLVGENVRFLSFDEPIDLQMLIDLIQLLLSDTTISQIQLL